MRRGFALAWLALPIAAFVTACGGGTGVSPTDSVSVSGSVSGSQSPSPTSSPSATGLGAHFENTSVSIDYPADWRQKDQESGSLFLHPNGTALVGVQVARWSKTLAKLVKPAQDVERGGFDTVEFDGTEDATLDGTPAVKLSFHGVLKDGTTIRAFAIWSVANGHAYRFGFKAQTENFDHLLPVAEAMMESFRAL